MSTPEDDQRALIDRAKAGEAMAFERLAEQHAALWHPAAALGCPTGTVKSRLHYALEKLRQMNLSVNLFTSGRESRESKP